MSEINPFSPKESDQAPGESNVFLDLNKPDEATGVPAVVPGGQASGGTTYSPSNSSEPSKFSGQVILAGLVFTIGVGSIYAMRYIGMQAGIKESVSIVEYTAATTSPDFIKRFDTVMNNLEEVSMSVQFPKDTQFPSMPFTLASAVDSTDNFDKPIHNPVDPAANKARLAQQRAEMARLEKEAQQAEIESIAMGLTLQSVIGGTRPVARISGQPVGVGMKVSDVFKVLSIKGSSVILGVEDMKFELTLGGGSERID